MSRRSPTLGERRVGVDFNPSGDPQVAEIKKRAAELIDMVNRLNDMPPQTGEVIRLKALAMTSFEEGAMWAVKAAIRSVQAKIEDRDANGGDR